MGESKLMREDWTQHFRGTSRLPRDVRDQLLERSQIVAMPAGKVVFSPGNTPDNLLFLLSGRIRVSQTSEQGREIVLYRVIAGESCVMTTACILAEEAYSAEGIAESDIRAVTLSKSAFNELVAIAPAFRDFVFAAYSQRLIDLLRVIDDVAFGRIDVRLAARLLQLAGKDSEIKVTQAQLATELGTAREVVTRQLHEFQRRGWISQSRGSIAIVDRLSLNGLANSG